ncbi:MAG: type II secretion system F family protein, partial [Dehalococcoidales bacterium]|nr:type II secretion system F family protein [Dehalococcoidales bacterium]
QAGYKYVLNLQSRAPRQSLSQLIPSLYGVKTADIIDFSRQLAAFLDSGSSLHTSLELLGDQATRVSLKNVISGIIYKLEQGSSFSQAVKEFPEVFPDSYQQVIQSSEKTGELGKGLLQVADYLESKAAISDKIKRALAYPAFVIFLAIGVVVLLVTTVLPPILRLFDSFQTELPPITRFALGILNFFSDAGWQLLIGLLLAAAALTLLSRTQIGRLALDRLTLNLPVLGTIISHHHLGLFCRTASMLFKSGLPLPAIMDVVIRTTGKNRVVFLTLSRLKERLMQGEGLARPMAADSFFPRMMVRMIGVGEQTGTLDSALDTLADYYEKQTSKKIHSLIGLIEPALTVAIGIGIAFVMYSMIIPIYGIMGRMH